MSSDIVVIKKSTAIVIKTILEAQYKNLSDPEVIKGISIVKRPMLAAARKQINKALKELKETLE